MVENDGLFRVMADSAPVMIWMSGPDKLCTYFNKRWLDFTGRPAECQLGDGWLESVHPEDRQECMATYAGKFDRRQEFQIEYRLRRHDGEYRWVRDTGVPRHAPDGSFEGYVGSCFDVTDSKLAEEALSEVNVRLIEAQERERARIARELHDDIGPALAIVGIDMLRAGQPVPGLAGRCHPGIQETYEKLQDIASRVSRISHQLHSPMLEYMGLAKAIEVECQEFSKWCRLPVSCSCKDIPKLDPVVALSFFRVVQEALQNAAKHSQASRVTVDVVATPTMLRLEVTDDGVGFDAPVQMRLAHGLGLISMRERMRLVGGVFEISSEPGSGARIRCRVPLARSEISTKG